MIWQRACNPNVMDARVASCSILGHWRCPPFLLTPENAGPCFEISAALRDAAKHSPATRFRLSALIARLTTLLADDADRRHLIA
jgi:hypothetical protein